MSDLKVLRMDKDTIPISKAVIHNGLAYVSGHVGFKPGTNEPISDDVKEQTRQTLRSIDAILEEAGTSVDKLVFVRVFLKEVKRDFAPMNEVFREWVGDHRPARTTVGADLAVDGLLVEIDCIAAVD